MTVGTRSLDRNGRHRHSRRLEVSPLADVAAEQAVAGALVLGEAWAVTSLLRADEVPGLTSGAFSDPFCRLVWRACAELEQDGTPLDPGTILSHLQVLAPGSDQETSRGQLIELGQRAATSEASLRPARDRLIDLAEQRRLRELCLSTLRGLEGGELSAAMALDRLAAGQVTATAKERDFDLLTIDRILAMPDPTWLVEDMIPAREVGTLVGDTGTYKSQLALRLCVHVQCGLPFAGRTVARGQVVYVDGEGGRGTKLRLKAILQDSDGRPDPALDHQVLRQLIVCQRPVRVLDSADVARFLRAITRKHRELALVVLDTLSVAIAGADENSSETMSQAVEAAKQIRDATGAAVLYVHHVGRAEKGRSRGGSAIDCNPACILMAEREAEDRVKVTIRKLKDGVVGASELFRFQAVPVGQRADGRTLTGGMVTWCGPTRPQSPHEREVASLGGQLEIDKVFAMLQAAHPTLLARREVATRANIRNEKSNAILDHLVRVGRARVVPGARGALLHGLLLAEVIQ